MQRQSANDDGASGRDVPALVIPIVQGDPYTYCVRTYANMQSPDGQVQRVYWITIQNGIHRAYALRSLGFDYMPCLLIDPTSSDETRLLTGNWSPERMQMCESPRPPLLKDFFDSNLTEKFPVRKTSLCVKVGFTLEKFTT